MSGPRRATGAFSVGGLEPGTHRVSAEVLRDGLYSGAVEVTVAKGRTAEGVILDLRLEASIAGRVIDAHGKPVVGAHVQFSLKGGMDWAHATTDDAGRFRAAGMSGGGDYVAEIRKSPGHPIPYPPAASAGYPTIHLADGQSHVEGVVLVADARLGQISGRVVRASGASVADARVYAEPRDAESRGLEKLTAVADATGRFVVQGVPSAEYDVSAHVGDGTGSRSQPARPGTMGLVLVLPDTGSITGDLVGFDHGATVTAVGTSRQLHGSTRSATARGSRFTIEELPAGEYAVVAVSRDDTRSATAPAKVAPGEVASISLRAGEKGDVRGRVVDYDTRAGVADCACAWKLATRADRPFQTFNVGSHRGGAITDGSGWFELAVPAADMLIRCDCPAAVGARYPRVSVTMAKASVSPGRTASIELISVGSPDGFVDFGFGTSLFSPPTVDVVYPGANQPMPLQEGDIIEAVNGLDVRTLDGWALNALLGRYVGTEVRLRVLRAGSRQEIEFVPISRE